MRGPVTSLLLVAFVAGCGGKPPPTPVAFKGKLVASANRPLPQLVLTFHPQDETNKKGTVPSVATNGKDGTFEGTALPGRYKVTAAPVPLQGHATPTDSGPTAGPDSKPASGTIPPAYRSAPESPWEVTIPEGGKNDIVLTLPRM
jgi:hypothetical protein